jgi:hypothetical protein
MILTKIRLFVQTVGVIALTVLILYGEPSVFGAQQAAPVQQAGASMTVPPFLTYQGLLRDPEGNLQNGLHKITFRIYDRLSAPPSDAIWVEEHAQVMVRNGFFSVLLGLSEPLSPALFVSPDTFIGVTVDPFAETVPRQRFASVPYAIYADHASALKAPDGKPGSAVYVDAAGAVGVGTTNPQAQLHISATAGISPTLQVNSGDQQVLIDENKLAVDGNLRLNGISPLDILLATAGGQVGIGFGVNAPQAALHIVAPLLQTALQMDLAGPVNGATVKIASGAITFSGDWAVTTGAEEKTAIKATSAGQFAIGTTSTHFPQRLNIAGGAQVDRLNVSGELLVNYGDTAFVFRPVLIYRFTNNLTDNYNGSPLPLHINPELYDCVVMGWNAKYGVDAKDPTVTAVWTYVKNERWYVRAEFPSFFYPGGFNSPPRGGHERPAVDVLCFDRKFGKFGNPNQRTFEGPK